MASNLTGKILPSHGGIIALSTAFSVLCLCFAPLIFNFIWGNHDWLPLITDNNLKSGLVEGRFSQYVLQNLLFGGKILPVLDILCGFALYLSGLYICYRYFFSFSQDTVISALFLTAAATLPYMTEIFYFHFITFSLLSWPLFIVLSLLLCRKASDSNPFLFTAGGTVMLFLALGGYPASVNFFVTAAVCRFILTLDNNETANPYTSVKKTFPYIIGLFFALLGIKLMFAYLQEHRLMIALYNSQPSSLSELLTKLPDIFRKTLAGFLMPQPFLSPALKTLTTAVALLFAITLLTERSSLSLKIAKAGALFLLPLSLKFSAWLVKSTPDSAFAAVDPPTALLRTDFYSFPVFLLFCLFYLRQKLPQSGKNIVYLTAMLIILSNIANNLNFAKVHLFGFNAENRLLERMTARIQEQPAFKCDALYTIVQAGENPLRFRYYTAPSGEKFGYYLLNAPYYRYWIAFEYYNFYAPYDFVREGTSVRPEEITLRMANFLTRKIQTWPAPSSLYVDDRYAILALTEDGKTMLQKQFEQLLNRQLPQFSPARTQKEP